VIVVEVAAAAVMTVMVVVVGGGGNTNSSRNGGSGGRGEQKMMVMIQIHIGNGVIAVVSRAKSRCGERDISARKKAETPQQAPYASLSHAGALPADDGVGERIRKDDVCQMGPRRARARSRVRCGKERESA
jgi:hypothetical protein